MDKILVLPEGQFKAIEEITLPGILSAFINLTLVFVAITFLFAIFSAGFKFILSGGNKDKTKEAGRQILNAFIGIILVFSTWAIMGALSGFFGVNLLVFEIPLM